MKYCMDCGNKLELKFLEHEGMIPYCKHCEKYQFEVFSTAVSIVILNKDKNKTLFIKQYGNDRNILVAGYVMKGESAEEAAVREMMEEIGVQPSFLQFQKSQYWEKSNTLILNFYAIVDSMELHPNHEVDSYEWYDLEEGLEVVAKGGLAEEFYKYFYESTKNVL